MPSIHEPLGLKYTCTDQDCAQYMSKISDTRYGFIEYRKIFNGEFVVCHAVVDLQDYSIDDILEYCRTYYNSLEHIIADYGVRDGIRIMAECIFEQLDFSDMDFNSIQESADDAIAFIHKRIGMEVIS